MKKAWNQIQREVEADMVDRFHRVPLEQRRRLGLESNTVESHENRQWVQTYVQMLAWKDKCRELHEQLTKRLENED